MDKICTVKDCKEKLSYKGFCIKHYYRWKRHGSPFVVKIERHGMRNTSEYVCWRHMKQRCNDPSNATYKYYGGKGITVCDRWLNSFTNFYQDMGRKPSSKHSIDRIDNNGNYEPNNCRWLTAVQQSMNKGMRRNSSAIYPGVRRNKLTNKWRVYFRNKYIGTFVNQKEAIQKKKLAEEEYCRAIA